MRPISTQRERRATPVRDGVARLGVGWISVAAWVAISFSAPAALALSVFDTIQLSKRGYSDQAIIDLIEATESAFDLEAADLPKLKQLGVSETVIRAMLARAVGEEAGSSDDAAPGPPETAHNAAHATGDEPSSAHSDVAGALPHELAHRAATASPDTRFTAKPVLEQRGGGHLHLALALNGLELLILRDEGRFVSVESRGQAILAQLRKAWAAGVGGFHSRRAASGPEVVFEAGADDRNLRVIPVLTVSTGDAWAYQLRSGRVVTPDLLAMYWADLLSDFWTVARGRPPVRLLALHEGEALGVLREALERLEERDGTLRGAADGVPSSTRHHLQRLAETVPMDYGERAEVD